MTRDQALKSITHFSQKCQQLVSKEGCVPSLLFAHVEDGGWAIQNLSSFFTPLYLLISLGGREHTERLKEQVETGLRIALRDMHATGAVLIAEVFVKKIKKQAFPEEPPESGSLEVGFLGGERFRKRAIIMQYDFMMPDGDHLSSSRFHFYRRTKNKKVVLGEVVEDPHPLEGAFPRAPLLEYPPVGGRG